MTMEMSYGSRITGATDTFPGLGRIEQLVLRGDGLTTTSLEILTGSEISVRVRRHWRLPLPDRVDDVRADHLACAYTGMDDSGVARSVSIAVETLGAAPGSDIIVREVLLTGDDGVNYGASHVVAVLGRLPATLAHQLATTDIPIGKLLVRASIPVRRELRRWGLTAAGFRAAALDPRLDPHTPVPSRSYLMRLVDRGEPLAAFTEWFAPHVFEAGGGR